MVDATIAYPHSDPHHLRGMEASGIAHSGPASKRIATGYGFWIFILSDMVMFSAFFATYAVLLGQTAGGPSGRELFDLRNVAIETAFLLASSFTCGRHAQHDLVSIGLGRHLRLRPRLSHD